MADLGVMDSGGAAGGKPQKTVGLCFSTAEVWGRGAERVHVVGWEGAPHRLQMSNERVTKTRQYSLGSNYLQYVPWLSYCRGLAA